MMIGGKIQLSERERATVARILAAAASNIGEVKVFGSRATGLARPNSDLDLAIFPPASPRELARLREAFEDSDLPIAVDVLAWDDIEHQSLRDEISRLAVPFFDETSE